MPRRTATLLTSTLLLIGLLCAGVVIRVPYSAMSPGPTVNTLGRFEGKPVLSVRDEPTYDASGHLNMTTVRLTGVNYRMNLMEAVYGWLSDDATVVPRETLYQDDDTPQDVGQENAEEFTRSQDSAKAAALEELGYSIGTQTVVFSVLEGTPAEGRLRAGDAIVAVDGARVTAPEQVADLVTRRKPGEDVVFTIVPAPRARAALGAGEPLPDTTEDVTVTTTEATDDGRAFVGIEPGASHTFPFEIDIRLADVGGPSAGLMFALGLIDILTPEDLTGGAFVAGTGTIDDAGTVGPIGGVAMKTIAARDAGADYFLTPAQNCAEAAADPPAGLTLVRVGSLDDALDALAAVRDGDTADLPLCDAR